MLLGMATVTLTPEQERFATEAVAQGRFHDLDEVVRASLDLLKRAEAEHAAFIASLEAAEAEGERQGFLTVEEVHRGISDLIDELDRAKV
jgi:putative addiction module CopG family antidote